MRDDREAALGAGGRCPALATTRHEADAAKTENHHDPSGRLGNRRHGRQGRKKCFPISRNGIPGIAEIDACQRLGSKIRWKHDFLDIEMIAASEILSRKYVGSQFIETGCCVIPDVIAFRESVGEAGTARSVENQLTG